MIKINGKFRITVTRGGKTVYDSGFIRNIITNAGKAAVAGLVGNTGSVTAFSYLAVGTSGTTVAVTDTTLGAEIVDTGLARASATISRTTTSVSNDTLSFVKTWTATGSKSNIQEVGIFNNSSGGTMLAHKTFTAFSLVLNDTLSITYLIQFS